MTSKSLRAYQKRIKRKLRRRLFFIALIIIVIFLLMLKCQCDTKAPLLPIPVKPTLANVIKSTPRATPIPARKKTVPPNDSREDGIARRDLALDDPQKPTWISAFKMQVALRQQKLLTCFTNRNGNGSIRWSALLEPYSGTVTGHVFEPLSNTEVLKKEEESCLINVLSSQKYEFLDAQGVPKFADLPQFAVRMAIILWF